jgi:hypothetical protein
MSKLTAEGSLLGYIPLHVTSPVAVRQLVRAGTVTAVLVVPIVG